MSPGQRLKLLGLCALMAFATGLLWLLFSFLRSTQQSTANSLLEPTGDYSGSLPWSNPQWFFAYIFVGGALLLASIAAWRMRKRRIALVVLGLAGILPAIAILLPWSPLGGHTQPTAQETESLTGPFAPLQVALFFAWALALVSLALATDKNRWSKILYGLLWIALLPLLFAAILIRPGQTAADVGAVQSLSRGATTAQASRLPHVPVFEASGQETKR